jgi:predicted enzyme related to lactoylglutathione lyase
MKHLITWASIPSSDFERAVKFYNEVTGRTFEVKGEGDERMATSLSEEEWEDTIGFGISADSTITPGPTGPRLYIATDDMDTLLGKVEANGGKVLTPKSAMGDMGFWGLIEDSEGNHVGLHSQK